MKREVRVADRVYNTLYPRRLHTDPQSFTDHLNTNLVSEVRIETQRFYGGLETVEARYPGLNYTHGPHIKRLSYFPHHKRLFEAFVELGLTEGEILGLCRWEGTLWARQRYERDEGCRVRDTTGEEIGRWVPPEQRQQRHARKTSNNTSVQTRERDGTSTAAQRIVTGTERATAGGPRSQSRLSIAQMLEQQIRRPQAALPIDMTLAATSTESRPDAMMQDTQQQPIAVFPIMVDGTASPSTPATPAIEAQVSETALQGQRSSLSVMTTDALIRMRALAELRASGREIDPSDPAFEQYLKEHAEAGEVSEDYQPAQTIANVMSTVTAMDAQSPPAAEVQGMDVL